MAGKKNILLAVIALLALVFCAAGCGGNKEKDRVAYLMYNDRAVFNSLIKQEFDRIAGMHNQPVEYMDAEGDAEKQIGQLEEAVKQGIKTIVLVAVDEEKLAPAVEKAVEAGVSVIAVNRHVRTPKVFGVYPDEYGAGKLQAEYMERNLPMGARIVYLQGTASQSSARERWEGFKERCLDRRRDVHLLDRRDGGYSREEGKRIMKEWLEKYPHVDAVVCGNDEMALGALEALKEAGRSRGCMVSGIDATEEALEAIAAGDMVQTVRQDAAHQAAGAYQMLDEIIRGANRQADIVSPFVSITKDNLAEFRK